MEEEKMKEEKIEKLKDISLNETEVAILTQLLLNSEDAQLALKARQGELLIAIIEKMGNN